MSTNTASVHLKSTINDLSMNVGSSSTSRGQTMLVLIFGWFACNASIFWARLAMKLLPVPARPQMTDQRVESSLFFKDNLCSSRVIIMTRCSALRLCGNVSWLILHQLSSGRTLTSCVSCLASFMDLFMYCRYSKSEKMFTNGSTIALWVGCNQVLV